MTQQRIEELAQIASNIRYSLNLKMTQEEIDFLCKELNRQISLFVFGTDNEN